MSTRYKTIEGKLYYITLTVIGWIDVFTRRDHINLVYENLRYCQENKGLEVYAYVIMSNHLHMVCRVREKPLNEVMRDFKSFAAKRIIEIISAHPQESRKDWLMYMFRYFGKGNAQNKEFQFWKHGNHPIELLTPKVTEQKIEYIHQNPVEAGMVTESHHYLHSSAHPDHELDVLPVW